MDFKFADLSDKEKWRVGKHTLGTTFFTFKSARHEYNIFFASTYIRRTTYGASEFSIEALQWNGLLLDSDWIGKRVKSVYPDLAWTLREPSPGIVPPYLIFAEVRSYTPIHATDPEYGSALVLVWFSDDVPGDIPAELAKLMQGVDWEQCAMDYSF